MAPHVPQAFHRRADITPEFAIGRALITSGSAWQSSKFANGSSGVWKVDFRAIPRRIEITIFGPLPDGEEIRAWLTPLLTIHGAWGRAIEVGDRVPMYLRESLQNGV